EGRLDDRPDEQKRSAEYDHHHHNDQNDEAYPVGLTIEASFEARVEISEIHANPQRISQFPARTVCPRGAIPCATFRESMLNRMVSRGNSPAGMGVLAK